MARVGGVVERPRLQAVAQRTAGDPYNRRVPPTPSQARLKRWAILLWILATAGAVALLSSWTGSSSSALGDLVRTVAASAPIAGAWWAMAFGLGYPLRRALVGRRGDAVLQSGLGLVAACFLAQILGSFGVLTADRAWPAWAVVGIGMGLCVLQLWRTPAAERRSPDLSWLLPGIPGMGILLVASCSAPGWLWDSEFGGYDALSYHLQLPREWLQIGLVPVEHNVYSYLPSAMEAAYLHVMALVGDPHAAAPACQMIHAGTVLLAAAGVARATKRVLARGDATGGGWPAMVAAAVIWATPWCLVTGSLAYNDMAVAALLAVALGQLCGTSNEEEAGSARNLVSIAILAGGACAAKLTASGFVVVPLGVGLLSLLPLRRWALAGATIAAGVVLLLLPMLLRNAGAGGNPVFPFATGVFGFAHWSAEQAARFNAGHSFDGSLVDRLIALWNEVFRYGIGPGPDPAEPWRAQWSLLWLLAPVAAVLAWRSARRFTRALVLMVGCQILFWLFFTHLKSRFMLPAVAPVALLAGVAAAGLVARSTFGRAGWVAIVVVTGATFFPLVLFAQERRGAPALAVGQVLAATGEAFGPAPVHAAEEELAAVRQANGPAWTINVSLPPGARILAEGESAPFWYERPVAYHTVWDRPLVTADTQSLRELQAQGFTHVLLNRGMLARWRASGWLDPRVDEGHLDGLLQKGARKIATWPGGLELYELRVP